MAYTNLDKPAVGTPTRKLLIDAIIDNIVDLYNRLVGTDSLDGVPNSSFENDVDADGVPDGWVFTSTGGVLVIDSSAGNQKHGAKSVKITSSGAGGGYLENEEFFACSDSKRTTYQVAMKCSGATVATKIAVRWFDRSKSFISESTYYTNSTSNPTTWTYQSLLSSPPSGAMFAKIRLYGANSATAGSTWFDDVRLIPNPLTKTPTSITSYAASGSFTVPDYINRIRIRAWGGGGGGAGATTADSGGGGGGGGFSEALVNVTPGEVLTVTIGAGGAAGGANSDGSSGGDSSVVTAGAVTLALASGGAGGAAPSGGRTGGSGGTSSTGDFTINGGNGWSVAAGDGGGQGGNAPQGGSGGARLRLDGGTGNNGRIPGGGGSGGSGVTTSGGVGARGQVLIEY